MAVGTQLGIYTLKRKLARGGMADIFLATRRWKGSEQFCVIKMMLPSSLRKPKALKLFLGEARLATQLDHPNIVPILTLDRVDDYYFIAMEYVAGETLFHLLHQAAHEDRLVSAEEASAIILQACKGLAYAHAMNDDKGHPLNLVHRDISPSNLILSYEGVVMLLDFGIADAGTRRLNFPKGKAIGKYGYMSPEQCRGGKLDKRSDIFSLGVVFWELVTGEALFPGGDPRAIMASIQAGDVPRPSAVNPQISSSLEQVVMRALETDPRERYQDARTLAKAIGEVFIDRKLPSQDDLAAMMVDVFGARRALESKDGTVGEELELATLLFDDLESEPPTRTQDSVRPYRKKTILTKTTIVLLALAAILLISSLGFLAYVDSMGVVPEKAPETKQEPMGSVLVDSTPAGARILVNGFETKRVTPAEMTGYPIGHELEFSLVKAGFQHWSSRVLLESDEQRRVHAILTPEVAEEPKPVIKPRPKPRKKKPRRKKRRKRS